MIHFSHFMKKSVLILLLMGSVVLTGCQKKCPFEQIKTAADLYPARPVPNPPQLSQITGRKIEALIEKANKGNIEAQNELAQRYHWANFPAPLLKKMKVRGWKNVEERAKNDYQLAYVLITTRAINDYPKLAEHIRYQADHLDAASQNLMGVLLLRGINLEEDRMGFSWVQKAADQGFAPGQLNLAYQYLMGDFVEKDLEKAFALMEKAAEQGYPLAQYYVGLMYARGEGVSQDIEKAMDWYERSANQGFVLAQGDLGELYLQRGDLKNAVQWLKKAASQGDGPSELALSKLYAKGEGVPQNLKLAKKLRERAHSVSFSSSEPIFLQGQERLFHGL